MTTLTIRKLDPLVEQRLRDRAARHGFTIEEEVRLILQGVVGSTQDEPKNAYEAMRRHFRYLKDVDLPLPSRQPAHETPVDCILQAQKKHTCESLPRFLHITHQIK